MTCVVAAASYSGTITVPALLLGLLPGLLISAGTAAVATRIARPLPAAAVGVLVALGWAELVNVLTGNGNGPAARSTFAAGGLSALAVVAMSSPVASAFLLAVAGVVAAALALGAGAEVQAIAVATALAAVVALAIVEVELRRWSGRVRGAAAVAVLALISAAAAAALWATLDYRFDRAPYEVAAVLGEPAIRPPALGARSITPAPKPRSTATARVTKTPTVTRSPAPGNSPTSSVSPTAGAGKSQSPSPDRPSAVTRLFQVLGLSLTLLLLALALRLLWVSLRWRLLRRRLRRGGPDRAVIGAWIWARYRLQSRGIVLPVSVSPDLVRDSDALGRLPRRVSRPLSDVADAAVRMAFAPESANSQQQIYGECGGAPQTSSRVGCPPGGSLGRRLCTWRHRLPTRIPRAITLPHTG